MRDIVTVATITVYISVTEMTVTNCLTVTTNTTQVDIKKIQMWFDMWDSSHIDLFSSSKSSFVGDLKVQLVKIKSFLITPVSFDGKNGEKGNRKTRWRWQWEDACPLMVSPADQRLDSNF